MQQRYPIPARTVRTETTVNRSRFIATIGYADTVAAARAFIQQIRQDMPDATHHVYAFRVGYGSSVTEGLSDDGEPAGTSGKPAMSVLRGADVGDVVLVVTRYFGGTKLGTGGLVRAYSGAAKAALDTLPMTEKVNTIPLTLTMPYHTYAQITRLLDELGAHILEETFAADVTLQVAVPEDHLSILTPHLQEYNILYTRIDRPADVTI
jgi:uncharacterized YigZ family protein